MSNELWIFAPIMAGKVSLADVKNSVATVSDLLKINALLEMEADMRAEAEKEASKK